MVLLRRKHALRITILAVILLALVVVLVSERGRAERYVAGERPEGLVDSLARDVPEDHPRVRFEDVTAEAGIDFRHFPGVRTGRLPEDMGSGVALGDVDGDGWTDVFLVNAAGPMELAAAGWPASDGRCRLFRNRGDGSFEDITDRSGIELEALGMAAALADVDADGDLDLFVTSFGRCRLFDNDGSGAFKDVSEAAGLVGLAGFWTGVAVGDYDRDGALDLYVCGYVQFEEGRGAAGGFTSQYGLEIPALTNPSAFDPERNLLLHGTGDGTFEEVAAPAGVANAEGRSLAAVLTDLTGDGWPDLYVANDVSDNAFFVNRGDGTFEDRTSEALVGDYRGAMGLAVGDFDGDLDMDLFITHWVAQENALYANVGRPDANADLGASQAPLFMDVADRHGLGQIALDKVGWATRFFDYDNDGRLDLFVVNGSTIAVRGDPVRLTPMRSQLFWNAGAKRGFFEVGAVSGDFFRSPWVGRGGATFDYDLDGDEDLIVVVHGGPAVLLRNDGGNTGHSVRVRLRQPRGNRFALGARLVLEAGGCRALEVVGSQGSYLSQHAVGEVGFGLGDATVVDRLQVTWPDGTVEEAGPFDADTMLVWVRGEAPRTGLLPGRRAAALAGPRSVEEQSGFYALTRRAGSARVAGDLTGAVKSYRAALDLWPAHEDSLYYLANCLGQMGDEAAALAVFQRLVDYHPRASRGWMQIGKIRLPGGDAPLDDLDVAGDAFARSHAINGEESGPVIQLGVVAMLRGALDEAEQHFSAASLLNPRSVESRYFGGRVAYLRGDLEAARQLLEEAHRIASGGETGDRSASSEGNTRSGAALLAPELQRERSALERWKTLADRAVDIDLEYGDG